MLYYFFPTAKMESILNDGLETLPCGHSNGEISTPPSPVSFDYHSEENCLKCFNYLETPVTGSPKLSKYTKVLHYMNLTNTNLTNTNFTNTSFQNRFNHFRSKTGTFIMKPYIMAII